MDSLNIDYTRDGGEDVLRNFDEVNFDAQAFKGIYDPLSL